MINTILENRLLYFWNICANFIFFATIAIWIFKNYRIDTYDKLNYDNPIKHNFKQTLFWVCSSTLIMFCLVGVIQKTQQTKTITQTKMEYLGYYLRQSNPDKSSEGFMFINQNGPYLAYPKYVKSSANFHQLQPHQSYQITNQVIKNQGRIVMIKIIHIKKIKPIHYQKPLMYDKLVWKINHPVAPIPKY